MIELTVHGIPAPQGSKVRNRYGGIREANKNTRPWRAAVAAAAADTMNGLPLLAGPLSLEVIFTFPRPKSHYRTGRHAHELKPGAPVYHSGKPDTDKLLRAIGDSLTGTIVQDDAQLARVTATKVYGAPACARILISELAAAREGQAA